MFLGWEVGCRVRAYGVYGLMFLDLEVGFWGQGLWCLEIDVLRLRSKALD